MSGNTTTGRSDETVVFLRDEEDDCFKRIELSGPSVSMQTLLDEFGITSLVECCDEGDIKARGLALRSPTSKLKKGGHYIVRERDQKRGVLFESKINVKEYRPSCVVGSGSNAPLATTAAEEESIVLDTEEDHSASSAGAGSWDKISPLIIKNANGTEERITHVELKQMVNKSHDRDFAIQQAKNREARAACLELISDTKSADPAENIPPQQLLAAARALLE